jgi:hypothetical protein
MPEASVTAVVLPWISLMAYRRCWSPEPGLPRSPVPALPSVTCRYRSAPDIALVSLSQVVLRRQSVYNQAMSTSQLLKKVEALPNRERERFVRAVLALQERIETTSSGRVQKANRVKWPDVEARAKRIFGHRSLPNLVLCERAEEAF